MQELSQETFASIFDKNVVVVDFYATWCAPCRSLKPILEELISERDDIEVVAVDIESSPQLAEKYGISALPTILVLNKGEVAHKLVGLHSKQQIIDVIDRFMIRQTFGND